MVYIRSLLFCALLLLCFPLNAWHVDHTQALAKSRQESKPILVFFNGSDWSGWAMKMKHEILDSTEFQEKIGQKFICLEVDFPKHTSISSEIAAQNQRLRERFCLTTPPTLLILDSDEREIARLNYFPESGEQLAEELLKIVEQDRELCAGLLNLSQNSSQLKKLYQFAQELRRKSAIDCILDRGLKTEDPFFFIEKYRLLVEKGEMKSDEARAIREALVKLDPDNMSHTHFTLALIEFQELSEVKPLEEYLEHFGKKDTENVWQIEMMIAQYYLEKDQLSEALKHAERAYNSAPDIRHEEIAHSLDYMRSIAPPS